MDSKQYKQIRVIVAFFVSAIVGIAVIRDSFILSTMGIITGMIFMVLVRSKVKIKTDERVVAVQEKAARLTYSIFAPTIGISALIMLIPSKSGLSVFAHGEFSYIESLGMVFAYLALFMIAIYAVSYHFLNRKYGGGDDE